MSFRRILILLGYYVAYMAVVACFVVYLPNVSKKIGYVYQKIEPSLKYVDLVASILSGKESRWIHKNLDVDFINGESYYTGLSAPKNYERAFYWYERSAKNGNAKAQRMIGKMYYLGEGVPEDHVKSFHWYEKAAKNGDPQAEKIVRELAAKKQN